MLRQAADNIGAHTAKTNHAEMNWIHLAPISATFTDTILVLPKVLGKNIVIYAFNFSTINFAALSGPTLMSINREATLRYLGSRRSKRSRMTSDGFSTNP